MNVLIATKNKYGGMYIHPDELPETIDIFSEQLTASLTQWKNEGVQIVWLHISSTHSHLIPIALSHGFEYHHCRDSEVMMTQRVTPDAALPLFATHTIGVGAIVLSENKEILTVVEQRDFAKRPNHFKFPGGMLEHGEHIEHGVVREVFEETGIETEFDGLVGFRHHHSGQFNTSNLYAVCLLIPLTRSIVCDEVEIGKALWMPVNEYLENNGVGLYNKHLVKCALTSNCFKSIKLDGYMNSVEEYEIYSPQKYSACS